jgi:hypothetical protein
VEARVVLGGQPVFVAACPLLYTLTLASITTLYNPPALFHIVYTVSTTQARRSWLGVGDVPNMASWPIIRCAIA